MCRLESLKAYLFIVHYIHASPTPVLSLDCWHSYALCYNPNTSISQPELNFCAWEFLPQSPKILNWQNKFSDSFWYRKLYSQETSTLDTTNHINLPATLTVFPPFHLDQCLASLWIGYIHIVILHCTVNSTMKTTIKPKHCALLLGPLSAHPITIESSTARIGYLINNSVQCSSKFVCSASALHYQHQN